jgi:ATP-binding cassette subfamily F protein 3
LNFGDFVLLQNISFNIHDTDKVGIVGVNGAGKSTLFKIICGSITPDSGDVFLSKGQKIGYLEQNSGLNSSNTILNELLLAYSDLIAMESRLKILEEQISINSTNKDSLSSMMKEYDLLLEKFSRLGGYMYNSRIRGVLKGLGFNDNQYDTKILTLSGGQKTRLALAKLLLEEPDILLLDEPTNHLDISALEWLEGFLKSYRGSVIIISHDRYFLDSITNKTIELENCECKSYNGNYTSYLSQKALNREIQQKHYDIQQKEITRMESFIEQQKRWNREKNIVAAESRQKAINRIEKIDKPKNLPGALKIKFRTEITSGNDVLFVEKLSKGYSGKSLFNDISFNIKKKENVFILGPNGCGKSTLLKIIIGKLNQDAGSFEYGHNVKIGYYDQEQADINSSNNILEEVWNSNEKLTQTQVRTTLAAFLFQSEDVFKSISVLSGGEKSRVALVKLMLSDSNVLILDEPTNHLDINSREVLEKSLQTFDGTILAVSHDRYFIKKLSTRILEFNNTSLFDYKQDYSFYLDYKKKLLISEQENPSSSKLSAVKLERISGKEEKAKMRKLDKQLIDIEQKIHFTESRISEIDLEMVSDEVSSDHKKLALLHAEQSSLNLKLEEYYITWEQVSIERENANTQT